MSGLHTLKDFVSEAYGPELTPQQCFDDLAKTPLDLLCRSVDRAFYQDMIDLVPLPVPVSLVWPEDRRTDSQYEQDLAAIARTLLRRDMSLLVPDAKGDLPVHRVLRMEGGDFTSARSCGGCFSYAAGSKRDWSVSLSYAL